MFLRKTITATMLFTAMAGATVQAAEKAKWVQLFNGKDLTGWTPKITGYGLNENYKNTFRVENGLLKVGYDGYDKFAGKFGHLFHEKKLSHYRLRVEYRR